MSQYVLYLILSCRKFTEAVQTISTWTTWPSPACTTPPACAIYGSPGDSELLTSYIDTQTASPLSVASSLSQIHYLLHCPRGVGQLGFLLFWLSGQPILNTVVPSMYVSNLFSVCNSSDKPPIRSDGSITRLSCGPTLKSGLSSGSMLCRPRAVHFHCRYLTSLLVML